MAANLITEICGGSISKMVESGSNDCALNTIDFDLTKIKDVLNVQIDVNQVKEILNNLGFANNDKGQNKLQVTIPSFRSDVKIAEDLIEEVIRIYGYDKIESSALQNVKYQEVDPSSNFGELRSTLCNLGLDEIISWSFIDSKIANNFTTINDSLIVANAISEEMDYMRPSLLPGLISALKKNQLRGFGDLSLFEIGKIFLSTEVSDQIQSVCGVRVGKNKNKNHYKDDRDFDVMDSKKDLFAALEVLGVNSKSVQIIQSNSDLPSYYHPYRSALIKMGKNIIGSFGEIHPALSKKLSVKGKINAFELFINKLPTKKSKPQKKAFIKSDFQIVNRDFAFILDKEIKIADLIKLVKSADQELISQVSIFDIYQGDNIADDKKSIAFNVEMVPKLETLNSQQIDDISNKIINIVSEKLNGNIRNS
jgi:phenylalanyl-tRNA synthetase beta chain